MNLTDATIQKTRQWFIDHNQSIIDDVNSGDLIVNNPERFIQWKLDNIEHYRSSPLVLNNFTFLQRAHFIQTGEMKPLMK